MTQRDLESRLRRFYRADQEGEVMAPALQDALVKIPEAWPAPVDLRTPHRLVLVAAAVLLLISTLAALAVGTGLLRLPTRIEPSPSQVIVAGPPVQQPMPCVYPIGFALSKVLELELDPTLIRNTELTPGKFECIVAVSTGDRSYRGIATMFFYTGGTVDELRRETVDTEAGVTVDQTEIAGRPVFVTRCADLSCGSMLIIDGANSFWIRVYGGLPTGRETMEAIAGAFIGRMHP